MKLCRKCVTFKELIEFPRHSRQPDGFYYYCKLCKRADYLLNAERERARRRASYAANLEANREAIRAYQNANREVLRASSRNWRKANPEAQHRASSAWAKANPDKRAAAQNKRHTGQKQRTPAWLSAEQLKQIEFYYTMAEAMKLATGVPHSVDHIVPLQGSNVSGLHVPWNLQVIPKSDNSKKGNRYVQ